jgi:hypothetical protein
MDIYTWLQGLSIGNDWDMQTSVEGGLNELCNLFQMLFDEFFHVVKFSW